MPLTIILRESSTFEFDTDLLVPSGDNTDTLSFSDIKLVLLSSWGVQICAVEVSPCLFYLGNWWEGSDDTWGERHSSGVSWAKYFCWWLEGCLVSAARIFRDGNWGDSHPLLNSDGDTSRGHLIICPVNPISMWLSSMLPKASVLNYWREMYTNSFFFFGKAAGKGSPRWLNVYGFSSGVGTSSPRHLHFSLMDFLFLLFTTPTKPCLSI